MLSKLFIYLIGLLLTIQGAKSRVTVDPSSCADIGLFNVYNAVNEMVSIANGAAVRTQNAFTGQSTGIEQRVVFNSFQAYFGRMNAQNTFQTLQSTSSLPPK
jgi:hypothetical protein